MMTGNWTLGACELAEAYQSGMTDPVRHCATLLQRIHDVDPHLNAFVALDPTLSAQAAEAVERLRARRPLSPLDGVPVAIKDNLVAAGMPAAWGGEVFGQAPAIADELPVARLRAAGMLIVGKTNTPEFAVDGHSMNRRFGTTRNPWDVERTPGGSSSGSVAAVAAGLVPVALGTDGGGSIRRPAGYCGLYGMKPGIGTVPRAGGLPQLLLDFETVGPVARHVRDVAAVMAVLSGPDPRDARTLCRPPEATPSSTLRILYVPRLGNHPCDAGILEMCDQALAALVRQGHRVTTGMLPFDVDPVNAFWPRWSQVALAALRRREDGMVRASAPYLALADQGEAVSAPDLFDALGAVQSLRNAAADAFARWDVIAMPASAAQPWPVPEPFPAEIDGQPVGPRGHAVYTGWVNAAGLPAICVPVGPHADGLPVGLQLIGGMGSEGLLLDLAARHERLRPGWCWPAMAAV